MTLIQPPMRLVLIALLIVSLAPARVTNAFVPSEVSAGKVEVAALKAEVDAFFDREVPAHLARIPLDGPLPERVFEALTTGEFSWGTYVRSLAAYAETRRTRVVGGRDIVPLIARVGVIESAQGSKAFSQLYAALALRHFGKDLKSNALWQSLSDRDRASWKDLLDPTRFYDPATRRVMDLPENFLGVAARVATLAFQMGVLTDRAFVDSLLDRAAQPFANGGLYADDAGTSGRYDRYSNEYARYVYEAAETAGREDLLTALAPSLKAQTQLWWDLVSPDGYGYPWGRSLGVVSYLDTLEIVAFLGAHPQFRPAPLGDLVSEYRLAWKWLQRDYRPDKHMLSVLSPGRGNYAYISREREWQQTVGFFGKAIMAQDTLMKALAAERVTSFPERPDLRPVARFEFFRRGDRPAGVWLVRAGHLRFALPITTGTKPGIADYLPAPHGLPGFAVPVEQLAAAGASNYEMPDGRILVASDGADEVTPAPDGRSLRATWRRFVVRGGKTGEWISPGFEVVVDWAIEGSTLTRVETIRPLRDVAIARLEWTLPSTALAKPAAAGGGVLRLSTPEGGLEVATSGDVSMEPTFLQFGDEPMGRGARGPVPVHLRFEVRDLKLRAQHPLAFQIRLSPTAPAPPQ